MCLVYNRSIESSSSFERLNEDYYYDCLYSAHKTRKLIEEFEEMSIEDSLLQNVNRYSQGTNSKMNYLKQDYYKRGFGLGKRKRAKPTCCLAPFDFSEFRKQVENVENHILTLTDHKTSSKLNCENLNKSQKKREEKEKEKEKSKEINCTIISLVPYNKRIIELIFMWKELFPKVYNKLITICTRYLANDDIILTYQQKIHKLNNLNSEDEASCQEAIDEFVMKTYQCILRANAKLSESIINMMTNGMKVDYEMADAKAQIDYCSPAMQVLAITDKANSEDDYTFINPVTYCTIEEVD